MYQNLGIHWASTIPAFLALACVPFPFLFYKYGKGIRLKCKYAAEAAAFLEQMKTGQGSGARQSDGEDSAELGDDRVEKKGEVVDAERNAEKDADQEVDLERGESRKS